MLEKPSLEEAVHLLEKSKRVLLAFPLSPTVDTLAASAFLAGRLQKIGKEISVSKIDEKAPGRDFLPLDTLLQAPSLARDLLISIDTKASPVGELRYEKDDAALTIILSPKESSILASSIKIKEGQPKADCIVTLGLLRLENLGELFEKNPHLFFETPIIALDMSLAHDHHGEVNLIDQGASSITEIAWRVASSLSSEPFSQNEATLILAGIISNTTNFLDGKVTPDTLSLAAECISRGGDRNLILKHVGHKDDPSLIQLWGRAAIRSRVLQNPPLFLSVITADDFAKSGGNTGMIHHVMHHLEEQMQAPRLMLLLWQDPEAKTVSAAFRSRDETLLRAISHAAEGHIKNGVFFTKKTFPSFHEAEANCMPLASTLS